MHDGYSLYHSLYFTVHAARVYFHTPSDMYEILDVSCILYSELASFYKCVGTFFVAGTIANEYSSKLLVISVFNTIYIAIH